MFSRDAYFEPASSQRSWMNRSRLRGTPQAAHPRSYAPERIPSAIRPKQISHPGRGLEMDSANHAQPLHEPTSSRFCFHRLDSRLHQKSKSLQGLAFSRPEKWSVARERIHNEDRRSEIRDQPPAGMTDGRSKLSTRSRITMCL